ncbi:MAG: hypothetical protein JW731_07200 [Bacteroidales bacterium]|nr:hypothetical protein [Bacteroidales bacterium]
MKRILSITVFFVVLTGFILVSMNLSFSGPQEQVKAKNPGQAVLQTNPDGSGAELEIIFKKGESHNHPLMAVWVEDTTGKYIQTLYVAKSIASGIFNYGDNSSGTWTQGEVRRPAALPYWGHKRGDRAPDGLYLPTPANPVPDAYTGATPTGDFRLETRLDKNGPDVYDVLLEINQSWDWNEYWTNNKYPDDEDYKSSSQPAVVYQARVGMNDTIKEFPMKFIGHSHYSGKTGELFTETNSLTTALDIADEIVVKVK